MQYLKVYRDVLNKEAEEGDERFINIFKTVGFYMKCVTRMIHPWPWLVGHIMHTGITEKNVELIYHSNDILHAIYLLYTTFSLVRLVDLTDWGRHSKVRIA